MEELLTEETNTPASKQILTRSQKTWGFLESPLTLGDTPETGPSYASLHFVSEAKHSP